MMNHLINKVEQTSWLRHGLDNELLIYWLTQFDLPTQMQGDTTGEYWHRSWFRAPGNAEYGKNLDLDPLYR